MRAATITWRQLGTLDELFALETQWHALAVSSNASLFCQYQWVKQWAEQFWHRGCELCCFAGFDDEQLVVLAPFYIQTSGRLVRLRRLSVLAQGEAERAELASEYPDILVTPAYKQLAKQPLLAWFRQLKVDYFFCRALRKNSYLYQLLALEPNMSISTCCGYGINTEQWSVDKLSRNGRSQWRRANKSLNHEGAEFKWLGGDEIELYWPKLITLHQARWRDKGHQGAFVDSCFNNFHRLYRQLYPEHVAMSGVFIKGKALALNYYLRDHDQLHFYQSGWDEQAYARCSPGFALHVWSILNSKAKHYDFMMGAQSASYKAKFSCDESAMANFSLIKSPWRTRLFKLVNKIL